MADSHKHSQEQSIKARKRDLYDNDRAPVVRVASKPFKDILRETPADPLSGAVKAALWAVGLIVAALLVTALMKSLAGPRPSAKPAIIQAGSRDTVPEVRLASRSSKSSPILSLTPRKPHFAA